MRKTPVSLLERLCRDPREATWRRLADLYEPFIRGYIRRYAVADHDEDDLVQEVLSVVSQKLTDFEHNGRTGAFRTWLRQITANRLGDFWRAKRVRPIATGDSEFQMLLKQLEDPHSEPSQRWDREHDEYVLGRLMVTVRDEFEPATWKAFARVTIEQCPAADVAAELGMTKNAVYIAKSRVLARLHQEAKGLID